MRTFLLCYFILGVIGCAANAIIASVSEWPRERQDQTLAEHVAQSVIMLLFTLAAGWILWGGAK